MLVTLADMKTFLGITSNTYDTFLTEQISLVSEAIEAYCRRSFNVATYQQTYYKSDYPPGPNILTYHYPVKTLTSIVEDGVTLASTEYRVNKPTGIITRKNYCNFFIADETVVTYDAGYDLLPEPIKSVVYSIVQERYNKKTIGIDLNFGSDVQRISIPGAISIDYDYSLNANERANAFGAILGTQINVLDYYRSSRAIVGEGKLIYL